LTGSVQSSNPKILFHAGHEPNALAGGHFG
jgi:hypothetical protein